MNDLKTSHKLFHSFCIRPTTRFDSQSKTEEVLLVIRAHPIILIPTFINSLALFFILFFLNFFLPSFLTITQILFINLMFLVFLGNYLWFGFLNWYFNVGIITNERVVDVDYSVVLYKEITYTLLSHVQDVTAKSGGFLESLFNFGNLFVQTAGTETNTEFLNIPHPSGVAKIINTLIQNEKHIHG
ncbi:hypothetical protein A2334_00345 [Candidatus Roizmanbacteria bacterium RIFOXYB2_FULL_38_10]|uniref:DUF304 domain-containing protein n=1 Tax=Candidatus Roizmanbacteria bacterium RIFOXYD1_FULL_38_12 TaxID=1802093 RepID=A0A1F7L2K4_9BACT|nr:MAG: hypothetical protein A3K47_05890 [Candidatus Roizmanbacteria bacterium RIFOXYA2_FULL_38_14]OGK64271.1 MAG: hypothetical protein A3K27_05890 [Candidatus Roizmanbacteria bacterium RIFOXYA1_FULL_37_12]OGK66117.1 MAG: hypothetical protein A3K38_05890 [Candidatus Roizmanbacteria bacterium RIFOXYB1_FULL_40_23]OGK67682.1 MAG: hypothetical protein A2334_00345 [Candidatus Roizmanbacteria bacterium RIFOXYB2_FULL_38_10]OGK70522.1 MAG: hypothetical protein A3K21_05895 [Candidatus Roizmanbacteria ba